MLCLKCKKEISDKLIRCNYCHTKVQAVCPICGAKNPLTSEFCHGCGLQLLKYCSKCGSVNLPNASKCRKCATALESEDGISILDLKNVENLEKEQKSAPDAPITPIAQVSQKASAAQADQIVEEKDNSPLKLKEINEFDYQDDDLDVEIEVIELAENEYEYLQDNDIIEDETVEKVDKNAISEDIDSDLLDISDDFENESEKTSVSENILSESAEKNTNEPPEEPIDKFLEEFSEDSGILTDIVNPIHEKFTPKIKEKVEEKGEEKQPESTKQPLPAEKAEEDDLAALSDDDDEILDSVQKNDEDAQCKEAEAILEEEIDAVTDENNELKTQDFSKTDEQAETPVSMGFKGEEEPAATEIKTLDQLRCKNRILKTLRNNEKLIVGISAPEGYGKTTVLKYLFNDLMPQNYAWLWGECSANSQISPYGIFQEMILTFFNMPNFSNMSQDFLKQAKTMLSETFPFLKPEEVFDLFNFLYPSLTSNFEEILVNRDRTFKLLEKLILEIVKKAKLIIVIDDFDMIDGASYAFLTYFVEQGHLSENIKLLITYRDNRITQGYFYSEKLAPNQYEDIRLAQLTIKDADSLTKLFLNGKNILPKELFEKIYEYSNGNSAYIEQVMALFNEYKAFVSDENGLKYRKTKLEEKLPKTIYQILAIRLHFLEKKYPKAYKTLCTAAIMGNKFNIKLLEIIMKFAPEEFEKVVKMLNSLAYISQFNSNVFEFKNTLLWKFVYEKAKQGKDFVVLNEKIFDIINSFTLSSNALKALIAQSLNQKLLALNIWTENIKLCAYLGDEHLWTLSQKQCLKIAQEVNPENNEIIINNIQERLGKLLYTSRPSEAICFLSNAISNAIKINNKPKIIELAGYLSKSCDITGNYNGVIESIDTILQYLNPESKLESALIKQKKLKAMFSVGNAEEIYNLASTEIIPVVEQALSGIIPNNGISMNKIYEAWLETNLTVALALISQGNKKAFDILAVIDDIVKKNNVENKNYLQRVKLAKALAYAVQGQIKKSEDILVEFTQETAKTVVEPEIISEWNFINILNKIYKHDWTNIKEDMYSVVTFANNYNDVLVKNLLRVFLGRVLQEEGTLARALDIYNEQVTIFAREKIAIGALLCWYFISKITLVTEGTDKAMDVAMKALEVAKNPKISNYYFMVLYKQLLAEIFLIKGDMESCKMYIEKGLMIAKQYDMRLLRVSLFRLYAKYLEEMVSKKPQNKSHYAQNAIETYKKVLALAEDVGVPDITEDIQKNLASFKAFCQLNSIAI